MSNIMYELYGQESRRKDGETSKEKQKRKPLPSPLSPEEIDKNKMKYCGNCKRWATPTELEWNYLLGFILFFIGFIPGLIYYFWTLSNAYKCPFCDSRDWITPPEEH